MTEHEPPRNDNSAEKHSQAAKDFIRKSSQAGVWNWFTGTGYVTWDPGKDAVLLFPVRGESRFSDWLDALHPDDVAAVRARLAQAATGRQSFRLRFRVTGPDGRQRWITAEGTAVPAIGPVTMVAQMWESNAPPSVAIDADAPLVRALSAMADGVTIWRALRNGSGHISDFELTFINDAGCRVNGMSREDQLGRPMRQWIPVRQDDGIFHACSLVVRTGEPVNRDWRLQLRGPDGERRARYFAVHIARLNDGVIINWYEVTRQRQLAQQSQHELAFLRNVLEHSPVALYVRDNDGRFLLANGVTRRAFGTAVEALIGRTAREVWGGEGDPPWAHETAPVVAQGQPLEFEDDVLIDGVKRRFQVVEFPIRDAGGRVSAIGGSGTDISGHAQVLEQLAESESRLRLATEAASVGIWLWDMRTDAVYWSSECYKLSGRLDTIGTLEEFKSMVHSDDLAPLMECATTCVKPNGTFHAEFRFVRADGDVRWMFSEGRCDGVEDEPVRMLGILQDITDRKIAEQALQMAERNKDRFMSALAHELRNYISPVRYSLHGLEAHMAPEKNGAERVLLAQRQLEQVEQMIDELMEAARIREGKVVLRREPADLAQVIERAVDGCRHALDARGQQVEVHVGESFELDIDPMRVGQAVTNLLLNSAKFSPPGSVIQIRQDRDGEWARVQVTDPGIGFEPGRAERLFELHEQVVEGAHGGLGIGLYLVRQFMQLHGGSADARSEGPGQGCTFTLKLPLPQGQA